MVSSSENYEDIYGIVKYRTDISREEFDKLVEEVFMRHKDRISKRAAAIIVARKLGVEPLELLYPPVVGRLIEVGPVRIAKSLSGETPFVLFSIVNETKRVQGVAFGEKNVNLLRGNEDRVLSVRGYTKVKLERYSGIKITEKTVIDILDDKTMPPITELKPAWAESLKFVRENRGAWLIRAMVLETVPIEYQACPICGKAVEMVDDSWVCPEHGVVDEPKIEKIWRFILTDRTGVYPAVYFKELPYEDMLNREVVLKGYFKDEEFYIMRFYSISEEKVIED